jgi:hypothetical protein
MNQIVKKRVYSERAKNRDNDSNFNENAYITYFLCNMLLLKTSIERGILSLPYAFGFFVGITYIILVLLYVDGYFPLFYLSYQLHSLFIRIFL